MGFALLFSEGKEDIRRLFPLGLAYLGAVDMDADDAAVFCPDEAGLWLVAVIKLPGPHIAGKGDRFVGGLRRMVAAPLPEDIKELIAKISGRPPDTGIFIFVRAASRAEGG